MKIKFDPPVTSEDYKAGRKRVKTKFLLFPKYINHELRWLEKSAWVQEVGCNMRVNHYSVRRFYFWKDVEWLDKYGEKRSDCEWLDI
ncbi:hypothetical protein ACIQ1D_19200 [Lysinibacillus xylanilyticus]|uniref:hypothetical protein n=1 Tax=Lysinibacillus xylanilyticus TaxID=582475 RepID=UPI00380ACA7F